MSTLITGGLGLLGSSIDFGFKPTKEELNLLNYNDLKNFIIKNNIDSIIHTAAKVGGVKANSDYVYDFFADNIIMNINVQNACKEFDIKKSIFIVSTCAFPSNASLPLKESYLHDGEPHETNFGYAYSKRMLEVGSRALKQQYQIDSTCVIPCNLYGENDNYNLENGHVIPSLIHRCYLAKINNTNFQIWGSGRAEREFIYVKDFAKIITQIFNYDINVQETMIISPETTFTIQEIVDIIVKKIGFQGKVIFDETKPEGILKKNSSNKIFRKYFPDFSFTDIDYGLEQTIQYFIKNYDLLRK